MYKQNIGGYKMLNSVILIGRLVETPVLKVYDNDLLLVAITLAVSRPFRNHNGEIDTDYIRCVFWDITAKNLTDYCSKGDCIAVRGRLQSRSADVNFETEGETLKKRITSLEVIGERVVFLSTSRNKKEEILNEEFS